MESMRIKVIAVGINVLEMEILETIFQTSRRYELVGTAMIDVADIVMVNIDDRNAISAWRNHLDRSTCKTILIAQTPPQYGQSICLERRLLERACHAKKVLAMLDQVAPEVPLSAPVQQHVEKSRLSSGLTWSKSKLLSGVTRWVGDLHEEEPTDNPYYR